MITRWQFKELSDEENTKAQNLAHELKIPTTLTTLLVQRSVTSFEEAEAFFRPSLEHLHDPFLMKDMDKAVKRLNCALRGMEKILIFGDYDVDGTTSVALMYSFLRRLHSTDKLDYYIPNRATEGYGISIQSINYAHENNFSLIIALDCGIKSTEEVAYASSLGIDFIICDHHTADESFPEAVAVLDPKRPDCSYPYEHLSGCGVGFKLAHAFVIDNGMNFELELNPLLDLLSVSIASDIVPINSENRILAHYGLKLLSTSPRPGLEALMNLSHFKNRQVSISDIVYKIGPRLNASGRLRSGNKSVELLISTDPAEAKKLSLEIDRTNEERREFDQQITKEATEVIEKYEHLKDKKSIVLYNPIWHKGVIGIVASRLSENFHKPTVIFTQSNGKITGSARSIRGFNLYEAVESCQSYLESFGGHKYAAGLTMDLKNLEAFTQNFEDFVSQNITPELEAPHFLIDTKLLLSELTPKFMRILKQFCPYGPKSPKPIFATTNLMDDGSTRVGRNKQHIKLKLREAGGEHKINAIAFSQADQFHLLSQGPVDICYTIEENTYMNKSDMQIQVRNIKASED